MSYEHCDVHDQDATNGCSACTSSEQGSTFSTLLANWMIGAATIDHARKCGSCAKMLVEMWQHMSLDVES